MSENIEQPFETNVGEGYSNQETGHPLPAYLPQLLQALNTTPFGEVKVILKGGQAVEIVRVEKIRVEPG